MLVRRLLLTMAMAIVFGFSILSDSFADVGFAYKCDGIFEVEPGVPMIGQCPLAIVAHVKNGPDEIRHLSRAAQDKCAYEDILSNVGGSNQIICRQVRK